jgi:2'-5' RNA ligase
VREEIDGLRRACRDGSLAMVPPHITLVPPVNVRTERVTDALEVLRAAAATVPASGLRLHLGPPATFEPEIPVLYLAVGGEDADLLRSLRDAVFTPPLERSVSWPFVPHVTLADGLPPERLAWAMGCLDGYEVEVELDRVHLLREGSGRVWQPIADAPFGPRRIVGRGGLPLELTVSAIADPEATALLASPSAGELPAGAEPLVVTARHDGNVVGVARGWTRDGVTEIVDLVIDPEAGGPTGLDIEGHLRGTAPG